MRAKLTDQLKRIPTIRQWLGDLISLLDLELNNEKLCGWREEDLQERRNLIVGYEHVMSILRTLQGESTK